MLCGMKRYSMLFLLSLLAVALSGCVYDGGYGPGYPSRPMPPPGGGHHDRGYHQRGVGQGTSDARRGLPNNPRRYLGSVPKPYRNDFSRGYDAGYHSQHRPGGGGWGGSGGSHHTDAFYDKGRGWGNTDRNRGHSYMPSRHYKKVPAQHRPAFDRGYARGYGRR